MKRSRHAKITGDLDREGGAGGIQDRFNGERIRDMRYTASEKNEAIKERAAPAKMGAQWGDLSEPGGANRGAEKSDSRNAGRASAWGASWALMMAGTIANCERLNMQTRPKKLLDTSGGNTKIKKTSGSLAEYRYAGLSLMPNDIFARLDGLPNVPSPA